MAAFSTRELRANARSPAQGWWPRCCYSKRRVLVDKQHTSQSAIATARAFKIARHADASFPPDFTGEQAWSFSLSAQIAECHSQSVSGSDK